MRVLFIFALRLILLAVFTFGFVVLFEHGPAKFSEGAKTEWNALLFFVGSVLSRQESAPARTRSQPPATPGPSPAPKTTPQPATETNKPPTGTPAPNR
jgi:hypothetical protein